MCVFSIIVVSSLYQSWWRNKYIKKYKKILSNINYGINNKFIILQAAKVRPVSIYITGKG